MKQYAVCNDDLNQIEEQINDIEDFENDHYDLMAPATQNVGYLVCMCVCMCLITLTCSPKAQLTWGHAQRDPPNASERRLWLPPNSHE